MKTVIKLSIILGVLAPGVSFGQIRNTRHDLSLTSVTGGPKADTETQICKFCHTPHKAQSTSFLWNHRQTRNANESWGTDLDANALTQTTKGTHLPSTLHSASKRCLGCHDGSVALGDTSNAGDGAPGIIAVGDPMSVGKRVGLGGIMGTNHPTSIPYAGQAGYNGITSGVPAGEVDDAVGNFFRVTNSNCDGLGGYCTTAPASDGRNGTHINLVPEAPGSSVVGVECTTCHEPHNKYNFTWFLRVKNSNASGLCRSCHNK